MTSPPLSARSRKNLATCHPLLRDLFEAVHERFPLEVICGHRNRTDQLKAFKAGASKLQWPNSKHNPWPSLAADVCPIPIDWTNIGAFEDLALVVKEVAQDLKITVRHGADWHDWPHWELTEVPETSTEDVA